MSFKLKSGFSHLSEPEFVARINLILTSLTSEPALTDFPDPWPAIYPSREQLAVDVAAYETAYAAASNRDRAAILDRRALRETITARFQALIPHLESVARNANDLGMLETTGYDLMAPPVRREPAPLPAPVVTLRRGTLSGVIEADVTRLDGAGAYEGQIGTGDPNDTGSFQTAVLSGRATRNWFTGLVPGVIYNIRFRGINSAGPGAWSLVGSLMAV